MKKYIKRLAIIFIILVTLSTAVFAVDYDNMMDESKARAMQKAASTMANAARELGYAEDSCIIAHAQKHWWKAEETMKWSKLSVEQRCYDFFKNEMGLSDAVVCGILANIRSESNFDYTVDINWGYGLVGWCLERRTAAKETEAMYNNRLVGQLRYMEKEFNGLYADTLKKLKELPNTADGAAEAARIICLEYEIPVDAYSKSYYRARVATEIYWAQYVG